MQLETEAIIEDLPSYDVLRAEASDEGVRQIERLRTDWDTGVVRFEREGEALLAVRSLPARHTFLPSAISTGVGGYPVALPLQTKAA
jgi:hypothetical protein